MSMTPSRPYMIRAIYEWIQDNNCTPHLLVYADMDGVVVPRAYVDDGKIVLNVSSTAVAGLELGNEHIQFSGRFGGVSEDIWVPIEAVMAIYARENGQGMMFDLDELPPDGPGTGGDDEGGTTPPAKSGRPSLKVVK